MVEPWPIEATEMLSKVNRNAKEKEYYSAYLSILTSCFPVHQGFMVYPTPRVLRSGYGAIIDRLTIDFLVESKDHRTVMMLQVKRATGIDRVSFRVSADRLIREGVYVISKCERNYKPLPIFVAVSALGSLCNIYRHNMVTGETIPTRIHATDFAIQEDLAPAHWWDVDLSTLGGRQRLAAVFDEIKQTVLNGTDSYTSVLL
jgi:hypothetical protein